MSKFFDWVLGKREEKIEPPDVRAIIKINEVAKENGIYDEFVKEIELTRYGKVETIPYSDAQVEALREQGIPVMEEEYSDKFDWLDLSSGGGTDSKI